MALLPRIRLRHCFNWSIAPDRVLIGRREKPKRMASKSILRLVAVYLGLLLVAGCVSTASKISTKYYTISGFSGAELDREISAKGPMKGHALAATAISFTPVAIEYEETETNCRFSKAAFRIDADITLPRWREHLVSTNSELRSAWSFLSRYARKHEEVHILIAEKHAKLLGEQLMALKPRKNCDRLEAAAKRVLQKSRVAHDREQKAFDAAEQKRLAQLFG
jgi:predicted secreted Zn-dependent protease